MAEEGRHVFLSCCHKAVLVMRQWYDLRPEREWRCFVAGGRLVGVCQRDVTQHFPQLAERVDANGMSNSRWSGLGFPRKRYSTAPCVCEAKGEEVPFDGEIEQVNELPVVGPDQAWQLNKTKKCVEEAYEG
eukprot:1047054-Pelagomonas_calceolata.AAC.4